MNEVSSVFGQLMPGCLARAASFAVALLAVLLPSFGHCQEGAGESASAGLRYGWKPGTTYTYKVKIEADRGEYVDVLTGDPSYTVASVESDRIELSFRGGLHEMRKGKEGQPAVPFGPIGPIGPRGPRGPRGMFGPRGPIGPLGMSPASPMTGVGPFSAVRPSRVTLDAQGNITREEGSSQLPYLLGNLSHLMIEPLPKTVDQTWTVANDSGIVIKDMFPQFGPFAGNEERLPAPEKTTYRIETSDDKLTVIHKEYRLKTAETEQGKPRFEIEGKGKLTFNKALGVFAELDYSMKMVARSGNVTAEIPVKVTYHLIDEAERAKLEQAAKEAQAERKKPLTAKDLEAALADLESGDTPRMIRAAQQLAQKSPEQPDAKVAKALEKLLAGREAVLRTYAAKALESWSTPESVPALVGALGDESSMVRVSAIKALGKHKATEAIKPIAERLGELSDRGAAAEFLKAMGPAAEPAVLKQLESEEWRVRQEAVAILKEIGTEASIPALEKAQNDPNGFVKRRAKDALSAVKSRTKQ
jgi:HEAT repeat protein